MTRRIKAAALAALALALSSCYSPDHAKVVDQGLTVTGPDGTKLRVYKLVVPEGGFAKVLWVVMPDSAGAPVTTVTGGKHPTNVTSQ